MPVYIIGGRGSKLNNAILIIGPSGSGKSTSLRNLDPEETFIINVSDKSLPWRGSNKQYKKMIKGEGNYFSTEDFEEMVRCIRFVNEKRLDIKNLILDDFQMVMSSEYMRRAQEKGYEKFVDLGRHIFFIMEALKSCRTDLFRCLLTHSELDATGFSKLKTIGKMIDEKIDIPSHFTMMFHTKIVDGKFKLLTQSDGNHLAKTPMEMFSDSLIDNDVAMIKQTIQNYNEDEQE